MRERGTFGFTCFTKELVINRKNIGSRNFRRRDMNIEFDSKSEKVSQRVHCRKCQRGWAPVGIECTYSQNGDEIIKT